VIATCGKCGAKGEVSGNMSNGWTFTILRLDERTEQGFQKIKAISLCPACVEKIPIAKAKIPKHHLKYADTKKVLAEMDD